MNPRRLLFSKSARLMRETLALLVLRNGRDTWPDSDGIAGLAN